MPYQFDLEKQVLLYCGERYTPDDFRGHTEKNLQLPPELSSFLQEWFAPSPTISVQTSGSTGTPQHFQAPKNAMMESARLTCSFLGLRANDTALLCMPLQFIGAKMVVVRALVAGLNLHAVPPSARPLSGLTQAPTFVAMTPMQVISSLPHEEGLLRDVQHCIIGGGSIDASLGKALQTFPHAVWSTYGMTETLSHIALRRLNGPRASVWYTPFEGVQLSLSEQGTLCIRAPKICAEELTTRDLAEIDCHGRFRIQGRLDNVINSGGIKIQIEEVERLLAPLFTVPFMITSTPDPLLGEQVVLLLPETARGSSSAKDILGRCAQALPRYWKPRHLLYLPLPQTESGKPARAQAKLLAQQALSDI